MPPADLYHIHRMGKTAVTQACHTVLLTASAEEQAAAREEWIALLRQTLTSARP